MSNHSKRLLFVLSILLLSAFLFIPAQAQEDDDQPVARAVLFYSPTCPHCEDVIQNFMSPLLDYYGQQLNIVAINVTFPEGQELYQATVKHYHILEDRLGVPTLVIDDIVLVGGGEIPTEFPGVLAEKLASGGTDWPDIPGLAEVVSGVQFDGTRQGNTQTSSIPDDDPPGMLAKFKKDPVANTIAVVVLIGMAASIIGVVISFSRPVPEKEFWPRWVIPLLSVLGIGVAFYLTYVETSGAEAVCGPVGDCNAVQLSPYATLFGVLPVGLLGIVGYALILIAWGVYTYGPQNLRWASSIAVWGMAFFGVLFSIYLTFLEPFVIGATCMWCISSAIFQTVIFLAATGPAKRAWQEDDFDDAEFDDDDGEAEVLPDAESGTTLPESEEPQTNHTEDENNENIDLAETEISEAQSEATELDAIAPEDEATVESDEIASSELEDESHQENNRAD